LILAGRWPLAAWRIMVVGLLAGVFALSGQHQFWPWPVTSWLAMVAVLIQVAAGYPRSIAVGAGIVTALGAVLPAVVFARMPFWFALILWAIIVLVLVLADALTGRYAAEASLAEQTALRQRDLARQAVLEERTRIARELHDVVAHHMSVVALQAEAAPSTCCRVGRSRASWGWPGRTAGSRAAAPRCSRPAGSRSLSCWSCGSGTR
jgi:signal transduction histidine kinase